MTTHDISAALDNVAGHPLDGVAPATDRFPGLPGPAQDPRHRAEAVTEGE
ncbi:hypothetical protein ACIBBB_35710 [Streptomyces sp. NPDC051217]